MGERLYSLQVLRAIAACSVVLLHATTLRLPSESDKFYFGAGAIGVDIFFVLSGVIISLIARGSAGKFLGRRIWRSVPLYWVMTVAEFTLMRDHFNWETFFTSLTLWPIWDGGWRLVVGVGWTLSFEMLFYIGATAVLLHRAFAIILPLAFCACWVGLELTGWPVFQFLGNPIILEFGLGLAIGFAWRKGFRTPSPVAIVVVAAALMFWSVVPVDLTRVTFNDNTLSGELSLLRVAIVGLPAAAIVLAFLNLSVRWPAWLVAAGDASYSIYLAHAVALTPFFFVILPDPIRPYSLWFYLFVAGSASFFVYQWIELPLLAAARRRRAQSRSVDAPATASVAP